MKAGQQGQGKGHGGYVCAILNKVVGEGLSEMVTFEQSPEGGEEAIHAYVCRMSIAGRGKCRCKGLEVGACVGCLRNCTAIIVIRVSYGE